LVVEVPEAPGKLYLYLKITKKDLAIWQGLSL